MTPVSDTARIVRELGTLSERIQIQERVFESARSKKEAMREHERLMKQSMKQLFNVLLREGGSEDECFRFLFIVVQKPGDFGDMVEYFWWKLETNAPYSNEELRFREIWLEDLKALKPPRSNGMSVKCESRITLTRSRCSAHVGTNNLNGRSHYHDLQPIIWTSKETVRYKAHVDISTLALRAANVLGI